MCKRDVFLLRSEGGSRIQVPTRLIPQAPGLKFSVMNLLS